MEDAGTLNYCAPDSRSRWQRMLARLFPAPPWLVPEQPHGVTTTTDVVFSWADRLRVLVSGHICVRSVVDVEHDVGRVQRTRTIAYVVAPGYRPEAPK